MSAIIAMAGFGQAERVPLPAIEHHQNERAMIPANAPNRVLLRMRIAFDAARAGHFGELIAPHRGPCIRFAIPRSQHTGRDGGIGQGELGMIAVVSVNDAALAGVETLAMIARKIRVAALLALLVGPQFGHSEGMHIHLVEAFLHRRIIHLVSRIGEVSSRACEAAKHLLRSDHTHARLSIHGVGSNEELVGLAVDHSVRWRAAHAFGTNRLRHLGTDLVKLVG